MELVYSIKYIDNIAYWFAMAMLAKHNKAALEWQAKSHTLMTKRERQTMRRRRQERRREKISYSKQCFNVDLKRNRVQQVDTPPKLSFRCSPWMMLLMMIGLKLSRASHEHVTMNGIHVNITNAHTQKYTIKNDDVEKWYAFLLSACVTIATVWRYHSSCWADHSVLSFSSFFHRILDRLFYL